LVYMGAIFTSSSLEQAPLIGGINDKVAHLVGYAGLGTVVMRAVIGGLGRHVTGRAAVLAIGVTVAYGLTDEVHQAFVPGRSSDIADLYADAAGAVLATAGCWAWSIIQPDPSRSTGTPRDGL